MFKENTETRKGVVKSAHIVKLGFVTVSNCNRTQKLCGNLQQPIFKKSATDTNGQKRVECVNTRHNGYRKVFDIKNESVLNGPFQLNQKKQLNMY